MSNGTRPADDGQQYQSSIHVPTPFCEHMWDHISLNIGSNLENRMDPRRQKVWRNFLSPRIFPASFFWIFHHLAEHSCDLSPGCIMWAHVGPYLTQYWLNAKKPHGSEVEEVWRNFLSPQIFPASFSTATLLWAQLIGVEKCSWHDSDVGATRLKSSSFQLPEISSNAEGGCTTKFRASSSWRVLASACRRKSDLISSWVRHINNRICGMRPLFCPPACWFASSCCSCWALKMISFTLVTSFFKSETSCWSRTGCFWSHLMHLVSLLCRRISSAYSIRADLMSRFLIEYQGWASRSNTRVHPSVRPKHIRNSCSLLLLLSRYAFWAFDIMLSSWLAMSSQSSSVRSQWRRLSSWRLLIAVGKAKNITRYYQGWLYTEAIGYECSKVPTSMFWPWQPQSFEGTWWRHGFRYFETSIFLYNNGLNPLFYWDNRKTESLHGMWRCEGYYRGSIKTTLADRWTRKELEKRRFLQRR